MVAEKSPALLECRARRIHTPCARRARICLSHTLPACPPGELTLHAHARDVTTTERSGPVSADPEHPVVQGELAELRRRLDVAYARVEGGLALLSHRTEQRPGARPLAASRGCGDHRRGRARRGDLAGLRPLRLRDARGDQG